jgi:predicted nucleotidyltransferase
VLETALAWREVERDALLEQARRFARQVRERLGEARIWVYGSVARGDFNLESDVDLLVVSPHLPPDPLERQRFLTGLAWGRLEARGLLPDELAHLQAKGALAFLEEGLEV